MRNTEDAEKGGRKVQLVIRQNCVNGFYSMAKWSKVVDLCSNLSEDVGSNATIARVLFLNQGITAGVLTPIKCSENPCKGYTNI